MRSVKIEKIEYEQFERIVDAIVQHQHHALVAAPIYRRNLKTAVFYFWDMEYIPKGMLHLNTYPTKVPASIGLVVDEVMAEIDAKAKKAVVK